MCQHCYSSLMQVVVKGKKYQITVYILASVYNNKVLKQEIGTKTSKKLLHSSFELNLPKQKLTQFELCLTWSSTNQVLSMVKAEPAQSGPRAEQVVLPLQGGQGMPNSSQIQKQVCCQWGYPSSNRRHLLLKSTL